MNIRVVLILILFFCNYSIIFSQFNYIPADSLFKEEIPLSYYNDRHYELGTEFETLSAGFITKARLFSHMNEGGDHMIRLWALNGQGYTLVAGPYLWNFPAGFHGWREYKFDNPIPVDGGETYIISISTGSDFYYVRTFNFKPIHSCQFLRYTKGVYSVSTGTAPTQSYINSSYYRDVVFSILKGNLTSGTTGTSQNICNNDSPSPLIQMAPPVGGTGEYTFQWQKSNDDLTWTDIPGAAFAGYSPPALTESTYYRRVVRSGRYGPVVGESILINVFTSARIFKGTSVFNNTATNFRIYFSGGRSPYSVSYALNGVPQPVINGYIEGTSVPTKLLASGTYRFSLNGVTDANGCSVQNKGSDMVLNVLPDNAMLSNKALVIINSGSQYFSDYVKNIKPYLENFGIPYSEINVANNPLPDLSSYSIIIFGHKYVYSSNYPIRALETAVAGGVGLCSFDPHLFDTPSGFSSTISVKSLNTDFIRIIKTDHFITQYHVPDENNPTDAINIPVSWVANQNSNLINGVDLATINSPNQNISLLQVADYGNGRIVKWSTSDWILKDYLGYLCGLDDLIWRGIIWAARKPFVMQGLPPMVTMRVDDVNGKEGNVSNNFEWIKIANEFGIKPWCGTFNDEIPAGIIPVLKNLIDENKVTASPHSFTSSKFIYFNHYNLPQFDVVANTRLAKDFYVKNGLKISRFIVPHFYEISASAFPEIQAMGAEYIAIQNLPDQVYFDPATAWINGLPYRVGINGSASSSKPLYYADKINVNGVQLFNCMTEIRDDGGYEWYPDNSVSHTSSRGIRHLERALNSMVLPTLFSHEYFFGSITAANWREILKRITSAVSSYNPEYLTMDQAIKYIRAKTNIKISDVRENSSTVEISYSGTNDMDTKCYLFTEKDEQITHQFITLPQINGSRKIVVEKTQRDSTVRNPDQPNSIIIQASPNPCNEVLNIFLPDKLENEELLITIYNSSGQVLMKKKIFNGPENFTYSVNTAEYENGLYFLRIVTKNEKSNLFKFVVFH